MARSEMVFYGFHQFTVVSNGSHDERIDRARVTAGRQSVRHRVSSRNSYGTRTRTSHQQSSSNVITCCRIRHLSVRSLGSSIRHHIRQLTQHATPPSIRGDGRGRGRLTCALSLDREAATNAPVRAASGAGRKCRRPPRRADGRCHHPSARVGTVGWASGSDAR